MTAGAGAAAVERVTVAPGVVLPPPGLATAAVTTRCPEGGGRAIGVVGALIAVVGPAARSKESFQVDPRSSHASVPTPPTDLAPGLVDF